MVLVKDKIVPIFPRSPIHTDPYTGDAYNKYLIKVDR